MKQRKPKHPFNIVAQSSICKTRKKFDRKKFNTLLNGKSVLPYDQIDSVSMYRIV